MKMIKFQLWRSTITCDAKTIAKPVYLFCENLDWKFEILVKFNIRVLSLGYILQGFHSLPLNYTINLLVQKINLVKIKIIFSKKNTLNASFSSLLTWSRQNCTGLKKIKLNTNVVFKFHLLNWFFRLYVDYKRYKNSFYRSV